MENTKTVIKDVSDTAFWVATFRAQEMDQPIPLFKDPLAKRLSGERGERISASMEGRSITGWTIVVRTVIIDNFIQQLIQAGAIDTVINLGAGLDTRPYRLTLPPELQWIEADYPNMMQFKNEQLKNETPQCKLERIEVDLADASARATFFAAVSAKTQRALILTEGVLPYLTEIQVAELAEALRKVPSFCYWIVDYLSPRTEKYLNTKKRKQQMKNAPFQFFPQDWFGFFNQHGWKPKETRYLFEEALRLGRPIPLPWIAKIINSLLPAKIKSEQNKMSGYFLMGPV